MKVAIVHFWLFHMRGGERVLEALCEMYPDADVFTHVYDPRGVTDAIRSHWVRTTFISHLPAPRKLYKLYLLLMPFALRQLDLSKYDLVISSEAGPAKGVRVRRDALHVCYCHSPMRYAWDMREEYLATLSPPARLLARPLLAYMRGWDARSARSVHHFVANSMEVQGRISRFYGRKADVVHPPVDVERFSPEAKAGDHYLVVSHLVRYKRVDLAVEACTRTGRKLVVIGAGEEEQALRRIAGPNVTFLGWRTDAEVAQQLQRCRALLFPGHEDFGMTPVEAMAAGRPVIAYGRGGALETVVDGVTGILFGEQSVDALIAAMDRFERTAGSFGSQELRAHAERFSRDRFKAGFRDLVEGWLAERQRSTHATH